MNPRKKPRVQVKQLDLVSMTQQHHAKGATPKEIMDQFARTGMLLQKNRQPIPFLASESYHEMLNRVADVQFAFSSFPATVRRRFSNDPYQALRFLEDPANAKEAADLGMLSPEAVERLKTASTAPSTPPAGDPPAS